MLHLAQHVAHFRSRVLQDALAEATTVFWQRRAEAFDDAAPRPGDYTGRATPAELDARLERCQAAAQACRSHAWLLRSVVPEPVSEDVRRVLAEVA